MHIRRVVVLALVLSLSACASSRAPLSEDERPPATQQASTPEFRLGSGDVVSVNVWKNPDLSVTVPVRPDGFISVPLVGDVLAGGQTPAQIAAVTEQLLTQYIRTPKVSVIIEEIPSAEFQNRVRVVGGVADPKSIQHRDGMTVLDLVLEAGGVNEFASPNSAKLYRKIEGTTREFDIYLTDILSRGILDTNYQLIPGDVITIPERRF